MLCNGLSRIVLFFSMLWKGLLNMKELLSVGVEVGDWVDPESGFVVSGCVMLLDGGEIVGVFGLGAVGLLNVERSCQRIGLIEACWLFCFYVCFPSL